jgi:soluble lytic murein transglycosylase
MGGLARERLREMLGVAALLGCLAAAPARAEDSAETRAEALLREGAVALARGEAAVAAERFAAAAAHPELAADAHALAARAWLAAGRAVDGEASARAGLARDPGAAVAAELAAALAEARAALGDATGAHAAWREAIRREPSAERAAALRLALAASLEASGESDAAARELRAVWSDAADQPAAAQAGERLAALEAAGGRSLRGSGDWLRRGDRLYAAQRSEEALAAYERVLALPAAAPVPAHAARRRADCLFRLRRYAEAEAAFAALGDDPEARVWRARSLARSDRVEEAIEELERIGNGGHGATSAWARYLAALLHDGRGRRAQALALFASAVDEGDERVATDSLWRLAWSAQRAGENDTARRRFRALAAQQGDPLDRLAARYWAARALAAADPAEAQRELEEIAGEYPFSYYGWRAAGRAPAARAARQPIADGAAALSARDLFAGRALVGAGLPEAGLRALGALAERARNVDDRIVLARLHARAGDYHSAQTLLVRAYAEPLARGVAPGQEELWRLAWPDAFAAERRAALPAGSRVDEWLVASILREESGYRPAVVSVSGAIGLLQLMPDTAARLAPEAGLRDFTPALLVRPAVNLRLGALYLDRLAQRFPGALEAVIASYNAGPEAVTSWRGQPLPPDDEWVEAIPYDETRGYVKRVLRSLHVHRTLYE